MFVGGAGASTYKLLAVKKVDRCGELMDIGQNIRKGLRRYLLSMYVALLVSHQYVSSSVR